MGPPPSDAARNKPGGGRSSGREDAIETLIDMDPCGASYRVARTMVSEWIQLVQLHMKRILFALTFHRVPNNMLMIFLQLHHDT